jgi:hypothetical protein
MQESTLICAPLPSSGAPTDVGTLLRAGDPGQDWVALDNANHRLHDDTAESFVAFAAELLDAPVVTWEIDSRAPTGARFRFRRRSRSTARPTRSSSTRAARPRTSRRMAGPSAS